MGIDEFLGVKHHFSDGLYAKEMFIPKDAFVVQHKHEYSHLSILAKGSVLVKIDEDVQEIKAPACLDLEAEKHHSIVALEDSVWFCIHATEETDINKIDEVLIAKGE
jgi:quercetin dioxygenase-like cupin family protein